ncbi:MAG: molybdopterin-dependent oxidoreductase [Paracoccaceae bacterium]|nr:molybdopterin-dependent oxidoreductase [Paracoccaceae bacterium]
MNRRGFLKAGGVGLVALIGGGAAVFSQVPVIPSRPEPDFEAAAGWIAYRDGRYTLTLPRAEMGQNIATAMKQIACTELDVDWDAVDVELHDTARAGVKPTVGSESVMLFTEPLAQACAALRDAVAAGRATGEVEVVARPRSALKVFQRGGAIGQSPVIAQGLEIVTGQPIYAADIDRPGMLFGRVLRAPASTEVRSRPVAWNADAAQAVAGFVAVVEDAGPPIGQAQGLGIVASRPGALDAIAEALAVEWDVGSDHPRADVGAAIDVDTALAAGPLPHVSLDGAPEDGAWDVDLRVDVPLAAHGPIEPRAAVAEWADERLTIWAGSQDVFYIRDVVADAFSLGADQVLVQSCRVGGGFGGKTICTVEAEAAALSLALSAPVKVQWTRPQEFALAFHRPPSSHRIKARLQDGRVTDWDHAQVSSHVMFTSAVLPSWMQRGTDLFAGDGGVERGMAVPYRLGRARAAYDALRLPVHTGPWRGLGAGPNALATESALDEAARVAGLDPLAFRLAHIDDPRLAAVLEEVGRIADWSGTAQSAQRGETRIGRGIACGIYKEVSYAATVAEVAVSPDGRVRVTHLWCTHECGLVVNPDQVKAQCEGNLLWSLGMVLTDDLPLDRGRVAAEYFSDAPIPTLTETPEITIALLDTDNPPVGAGETAMVSGPGAIANAIRAATGHRLSRFPVDVTELAA